MRAPHLSLRATLVLYVLLPLSASMAVTGYLALRTWEEQVESRLQKDLEMVARAIQLPLSHALERKRQGGMEQTLKSAISVDSVYSAYAYDLDGEQIVAAGVEDPTPKRDRLTEMASEGVQTGEYGQVGKRRVYSYFVPLIDSRNQTRGMLQLTRRERDFRQYKRQVRRNALLWFGASVLVMGGLVLVGQYQALGRHFQRLIEGMQRVAKGDSDHRLPITGPREIGSISASFNQMLNSIQEAERALQEKRLKQLALEKKLRHSEKLAAVGQLAAGIAHELGTPLSTISGIAQRAKRSASEGVPRASDLMLLSQEVTRMEVIIRQLLDFSHSGHLQCRSLSPARVAHSAVAALAEDALAAEADIRLVGDEDAPDFFADPIRMEQALVNLLRNAIQAADQVTIQLDWRVEEGMMVFTVDDSGPGISEQIRERLFEPFFTTKQVGKGTGLGLAVVHGIMADHGGMVQVGMSQLGGARLELFVPLTPQEEDAE